jgi:multicomponent Na+:H+ antiporter subunit D
VVYQGFFGKPAADEAPQHHKEASPAMVVPLCLTAAISAVLGFYPDFFLRFAEAVVK